MRTITVVYGPDDALEFAQAHLAPLAWQAIDESIRLIEDWGKFQGMARSTLNENVLTILTNTRAKLHA